MEHVASSSYAWDTPPRQMLPFPDERSDVWKPGVVGGAVVPSQSNTAVHQPAATGGLPFKDGHLPKVTAGVGIEDCGERRGCRDGCILCGHLPPSPGAERRRVRSRRHRQLAISPANFNKAACCGAAPARRPQTILRARPRTMWDDAPRVHRTVL